MTDTKLTNSEQQAVAQLESIKEMVAALQCDYSRLEELRDERDAFEFDEDVNLAPDGPGYANDKEAWAAENPDDAEELAELEAAAGECESEEDARQRLDEDPLSIEVRDGWRSPGAESDGAEEYCILLCTGGPACRIIGTIDKGEPQTARLQHQDWGTPWTDWIVTGDDYEALLAYARHFCFEE